MKRLVIKSKVEGGHVKARLFMGPVRGALANLGTIVFAEDEFGPFCEALYMGAAWVDDLEVEIEARGEDEQSQLEKVSIQMASAKEQIEQLNTDVADERSRILGLYNQLAEAKGEEDD